MIKNLIYILIAILVLVVVLGFSNRFQKIAEKYDQSPLGGTGTDLYFSCSMFAVLVSAGVIIYNVIRIIIFFNQFL